MAAVVINEFEAIGEAPPQPEGERGAGAAPAKVDPAPLRAAARRIEGRAARVRAH